MNNQTRDWALMELAFYYTFQALIDRRKDGKDINLLIDNITGGKTDDFINKFEIYSIENNQTTMLGINCNITYELKEID